MRHCKPLAAASAAAALAVCPFATLAATGRPIISPRGFTFKDVYESNRNGATVAREADVVKVTGATSVTMTMMQSYNYKPFICKYSDPKCGFGPALLVGKFKGSLAFHQVSASTWKLVTSNHKYLKTYNAGNLYGAAIGWLYTVTAHNAAGATSQTFWFVTDGAPYPTGGPPTTLQPAG